MDIPRTTLLLFPSKFIADADDQEITRLEDRIKQTTGLQDLQLRRRGPAAVEFEFPARNARERERVRQLLADNLEGWSVGEKSTYSLPRAL